jgi:hypothetical protein
MQTLLYKCRSDWFFIKIKLANIIVIIGYPFDDIIPFLGIFTKVNMIFINLFNFNGLAIGSFKMNLAKLNQVHNTFEILSLS